MKRPTAILAATLALGATPLMAQRDGPLGTLPGGMYQCSLPGSAGGAAWVPIEGKRFVIKNASRYIAPEGSGTYLMTGNELVFTRGPLKDQRYLRTGSSILRMRNEDGTLGRIRCVRVSMPEQR